MKKLIAILLIMSLTLLTIVGCSSGESPADVATSSPPGTSSSAQTTGDEIKSEVPLDTLLVGVQEMSGDFISGFGNSAYDLSIKVLTGGYMSTYEIDAQGEIVLNNTVVSNLDITTDNTGNKTYKFTLHDDLLWNNAEQITAKDYVASILWYSSPQWAEAGASSSGSDALVGYTEYNAGETDVFAGVKLISDLEFSVTIAAEELPYYWETLHASAGPIHLKTYIQSGDVVTTDEGTSFVFTEGDLLENCNRIAAEERYAPTVTCGPYSFVSFENQTVTMELNEHFKGDLNGDKPTLQYVVQQAIPLETDAEWVIAGQVDIVEGIVEHEKIEAVKAAESAQYQTYLRSGYGYLAMLCDEGVTADVNVRWALASLVDRSEVVNYVLGGYGSTVDAEYGIGQWMYQEMAADLQEALIPISFNIDTANDYLDKTEWIYEEDGSTPFDRTKATEDGSYMRYNDAGEPLVVNHLGQDGNVLTDIIEIQYAANAPLAGLQFNLDKGEWSAVLANYYDANKLLGDARIYNTFNLATNFSAVFDRYYTWHSDNLETALNKARLSDETLDELIVEMRSTDPNSPDVFLDAWFDYQVRFNELMPQVPLYSNEYYDISHVNVDNLNTSAYAGYENIICQISKSEK